MAAIVNLTESSLIALHGLVLVARAALKPVSVKRFASVLGASENTVAKVMQRLVKAGFLRSSRGPKGGFLMARPAREVTLLSIYEAMEGKVETDTCPFGKKICVFGECIFGDFMSEIAADFRARFSGKTLADYIDGRPPKDKTDMEVLR